MDLGLMKVRLFAGRVGGCEVVVSRLWVVVGYLVMVGCLETDGKVA